MLTEQQARKSKKSASFHYKFELEDMYKVSGKNAWKLAKQIRKHYSKYINQIKTNGRRNIIR